MNPELGGGGDFRAFMLSVLISLQVKVSLSQIKNILTPLLLLLAVCRPHLNLFPYILSSSLVLRNVPAAPIFLKGKSQLFSFNWLTALDKQTALSYS